MSFIDPQMTNGDLPNGWHNYQLHTEVRESDYPLIRHLENTKWVHFANGGDIIRTQSGRPNLSNPTRWYGLKLTDVLKS